MSLNLLFQENNFIKLGKIKIKTNHEIAHPLKSHII